MPVSDVLEKLQQHIKGQRNEALHWRELLRCKQSEGETIDDFYVRLRTIT